MAGHDREHGDEDADMEVGPGQQMGQPGRPLEQRRLGKSGSRFAHRAVQRLANEQQSDEVEQQSTEHLMHPARQPDRCRKGSPARAA